MFFQKKNKQAQNQDGGTGDGMENNIGNEKPKIGFNLKVKSVLIPVAVLAVVAVAVVGYYWMSNNMVVDEGSQMTMEEGDVPVQKTGFWKFGLVRPVFAQVENILSGITPSAPGDQVSVDEIENLSSFFEEENIWFTDEQKQALEDYGFFLVENDLIQDQSAWGDKDDFVDSYDVFDGDSDKYKRKPNNAIFITSDMALHLYHILIDRSFQRMEETKFQPMLKTMTEALFLDSIDKYNTASDEKLKDSYKRLSAFYLIPLVVLDAGDESAELQIKPEDYSTFAEYLTARDNLIIKNSQEDLIFSLGGKEYKGIELSDEIFELAKSELELIEEAKGVKYSPLFSTLRSDKNKFKNDYSQFKPRSHYTKNDVLKSYFISMMWYGRMGFTVKSPELTRDALIMTGQINNLKAEGQDLSELWSKMSVVIDFFVGEVDDLTAYQYTDLISQVYGSEGVSDLAFTDDEKLNQFIEKAKKELPLPKILSEAIEMPDYDDSTKEELLAETMQFRFMGQRFTPDAYIINKLTQGDEAPDPETGQKLPTMPTALMPIHMIEPGNAVVEGYLNEWINDPDRIAKQGRESDKVIAKVLGELKQEFSAYNESDWTQNIYWGWLNCFRPLLKGYGQGYPYFMQTSEWLKKNLGTVLGSYTELKHDTLLYAKQSYAERGGGGPDPGELPPVVKGYVEPDLVFWNKIIALAEATKKGLEDRDVFPKEFDRKYTVFVDSAKFLRDMVEQELQNKQISEDDFEKLRTINSSLGFIVEPIGGQELTEKEKRAGIVADIHTDAVLYQILYEATGKPYIIYTAVKDANGARLTRGVVFNHYEFAGELDERLSDEDWQERVYEGQSELPEGDEWTLELVK